MPPSPTERPRHPLEVAESSPTSISQGLSSLVFASNHGRVFKLERDSGPLPVWDRLSERLMCPRKAISANCAFISTRNT
jgi:hypothetical protein